MKSTSCYKYFPVSPDDERWGLYITTCGHSIVAPNSPYPPEQHPDDYHFKWSKGRTMREFCLLYITQGSGFFESRSSGKKHVSEGSFMLLFPNEWHRYRPTKETGWTEYWVGFHGSYATSLVRDFMSKASPIIHVGTSEDILENYLKLLELSKREPVGFQQIMAGHTAALLGHFYQSQKGRNTVTKETDALIHKAKCRIMETLSEPFDPKSLATELNVSYSWLRRTFKHYTGLPLLQYQLQIRINKAKRLLTSSESPVYIIAEQCGFESCYYFSRLFKLKTGTTPTDYRK